MGKLRQVVFTCWIAVTIIICFFSTGNKENLRIPRERRKWISTSKGNSWRFSPVLMPVGFNSKQEINTSYSGNIQNNQAQRPAANIDVLKDAERLSTGWNKSTHLSKLYDTVNIKSKHFFSRTYGLTAVWKEQVVCFIVIMLLEHSRTDNHNYNSEATSGRNKYWWLIIATLFSPLEPLSRLSLV